MRFWDSSAIVPLVVQEPATPGVLVLATDDPEMLVWWTTSIECTSALARLERDGMLDAPAMELAVQRLEALEESWHELQPVMAVRSAARRLLRVHTLRAADALQLAAAVVAAEGEPRSLEFVTLDERLGEAARKEGFPVVGTAA